MGHQLARAAAAATLIVLAACGGDDDAAPSVLDNALAQVHDDVTEGSGASTDLAPATSADDAAPAPDELPAPDPALFEGANRVVNLWVGPDAEHRAVDVWGRRTFTTGPILVAEDIGFGEASDYFSAPPGYHLSIVGAGAGPDGEELAGAFNAADGEQITTIFTNDDALGAVSAPNIWERGPDDAFDPPAPPGQGRGLVVLVAANTRAFGESTSSPIARGAYYVGDGTGACRPQRIEEQGFAPDVLGGTQDVRIEVPPGPTTFTLHPWSSPDTCAQPASLELSVDVPEGGIVLVIVHSPDGETLDAVQLLVD